MTTLWDAMAKEDYEYWLKHDKKTIHRINQLIEAIELNPYRGIGKPEQLKHHLSGCWSRRINAEHRLIYFLSGNTITILKCRYHYSS